MDLHNYFKRPSDGFLEAHFRALASSDRAERDVAADELLSTFAGPVWYHADWFPELTRGLRGALENAAASDRLQCLELLVHVATNASGGDATDEIVDQTEQELFRVAELVLPSLTAASEHEREMALSLIHEIEPRSQYVLDAQTDRLGLEESEELAYTLLCCVGILGADPQGLDRARLTPRLERYSESAPTARLRERALDFLRRHARGEA